MAGGSQLWGFIVDGRTRVKRTFLHISLPLSARIVIGTYRPDPILLEPPTVSPCGNDEQSWGWNWPHSRQTPVSIEILSENMKKLSLGKTGAAQGIPKKHTASKILSPPSIIEGWMATDRPTVERPHKGMGCRASRSPTNRPSSPPRQQRQPRNVVPLCPGPLKLLSILALPK